MNGKCEDLRLEGDWGKLMDICNMQHTYTPNVKEVFASSNFKNMHIYA